MSLPKSGFYYPNKFMRLYLEGIEEFLGRAGLVELLTLAGIPQFARHPLPDNLEKSIDFAYITAVQEAFENLNIGKNNDLLAVEAGRRVFAKGLATFGNQMGVMGLPDLPIPEDQKMKTGLRALATVMMEFSDQISNAYQWDETTFVYTLERCPMCWRRKTDRAVCFGGQGLLQESVDWLTNGQHYQVEMVSCIAQGDEMGKYMISALPIEADDR